MPAPQSPPPGAIPSFDSPDAQAMMSQMMGGKAGKPGQTPQSTQQKPARPIGTPVQEAQMVGEDVAQGLLQLLPDFLQDLFHVKPTDTPEEAAKKKQMLQRYNQLNAEQQQFVQKKYQEEQAKKKQEEEEATKKKQEEQRKAQENELPVPQGKKTGDWMAGKSQKQNTLTKMQNDRQKLSSAG